MLLRSAGPADVAALAHVHVTSWRETYEGLMPAVFLDRMTSDETRARRARHWVAILADPAQLTLVAEVDGEVVGFVNGGPAQDHPGYDAELYALYLLAAAQGRGIGAALFRALAGRRAASMALWVLDVNPTRGFYARMGGAEDGEKRVSVAGGELRELRYGWKALP